MKKQPIIIGIDYGIRNLGFSISDGDLVQPLKTMKISSFNNALEIVVKTAKQFKIDKIVIGISEGVMAEKTQLFADAIKKQLKIPVILSDETLSSYQSRQYLAEQKTPFAKRKQKEHLFSACIILQNYLDSQSNNC